MIHYPLHSWELYKPRFPGKAGGFLSYQVATEENDSDLKHFFVSNQGFGGDFSINFPSAALLMVSELLTDLPNLTFIGLYWFHILSRR